MKKDKCEELFELVNNLGEILEGDLHIIDSSETHPACEGEAQFRVYHRDGYCFDISKRCETENEETGEAETWSYDFFAEWEGFDKINEVKAVELIKSTQIHRFFKQVNG